MANRRAEITSVAGHSGRWQTYLASAIGADHVRAGSSCQDAVGTDAFDLPGANGALAFAVADGHGHARHFRSARGSKLAVQAALAAAAQWVAAVAAGGAVSPASAGELVADVVARWRSAVAADLAADPLAEPQLSAVQPGDPAEIPYGSTLLLVVVHADIAMLAQIGDGEILLISPDGRCLTPVPGDDSLDGTQTTSLCQSNARSAFRVALVSLTKTPAYAIFAATDGYGNAQARDDWQPSLAADLVRLGTEHSTEWLGSQLSDWAGRCASSDGSGDDTSVALAFDTTAVLTGPAKPAELTMPAAAVDLSGSIGRTMLPPDGPSGRPLAPDRTVRLPDTQAGHDPASDRTLRLPDAQARRDPGSDRTLRLSDAPPGSRPPGRRPPDDRTLGLPGVAPVRPSASDRTLGLRPPPEPAPAHGHRGEEPSAQRTAISRSGLWLAGALIVVIAVVIFLFVHSRSHPPAPGFSPSPSPAASTSPHPSPSQSPAAGTSVSPGKHHHSRAAGQLSVIRSSR